MTTASDARTSATRYRPWVAVAFVLMVMHNVDEAFIHPEPGGKISVVGDTILGIVLVYFYPRLGRRWRIAVTAILGTVGTLQALGGHVVHVVQGNAVPLDYSGFLFLAGGLVLIAVAVAEFRRGR